MRIISFAIIETCKLLFWAICQILKKQHEVESDWEEDNKLYTLQIHNLAKFIVLIIYDSSGVLRRTFTWKILWILQVLL